MRRKAEEELTEDEELLTFAPHITKYRPASPRGVKYEKSHGVTPTAACRVTGRARFEFEFIIILASNAEFSSRFPLYQGGPPTTTTPNREEEQPRVT